MGLIQSLLEISKWTPTDFSEPWICSFAASCRNCWSQRKIFSKGMVALLLRYWHGFKRLGFSLQLQHSWPCPNHFRSLHISFPFVEWGMHPKKLMCGEVQGCLKQETNTWRHQCHVSSWNSSSVGPVSSVTPMTGYEVTVPAVSSCTPSSLRAPGSCAHSWHNLIKLPGGQDVWPRLSTACPGLGTTQWVPTSHVHIHSNGKSLHVKTVWAGLQELQPTADTAVWLWSSQAHKHLSEWSAWTDLSKPR